MDSVRAGSNPVASYRPSLAGERRGLSRGEGAPPGTLKAILPGNQAAHHSPLLAAALDPVSAERGKPGSF